MARKSARALWTAKIVNGSLPSPSKSKKKASVRNPMARRGSAAIIIGIDPSLRGTGLAVIDTRSTPPRLLSSQTIKVPAKLKAYECLGLIAEHVEKLTRQFCATEAAIEETIYVQNFRTAQAMGASRGAALSVLARLNVTVNEYAPKRIKLAVAGHGAASKEQVGRMIKAVFGLSKELPLDESDAAAVALCHAYTSRD